MLGGPLPPAPGATQVDEILWLPSGLRTSPSTSISMGADRALRLRAPHSADGPVARFTAPKRRFFHAGELEHPMSAQGTPYWQATRQHAHFLGAQHIGRLPSPGGSPIGAEGGGRALRSWSWLLSMVLLECRVSDRRCRRQEVALFLDRSGPVEQAASTEDP